MIASSYSGSVHAMPGSSAKASARRSPRSAASSTSASAGTSCGPANRRTSGKRVGGTGADRDDQVVVLQLAARGGHGDAVVETHLGQRPGVQLRAAERCHVRERDRGGATEPERLRDRGGAVDEVRARRQQLEAHAAPD